MPVRDARFLFVTAHREIGGGAACRPPAESARQRAKLTGTGILTPAEKSEISTTTSVSSSRRQEITRCPIGRALSKIVCYL
jgi:hypothetical protein